MIGTRLPRARAAAVAIAAGVLCAPLATAQDAKLPPSLTMTADPPMVALVSAPRSTVMPSSIWLGRPIS